MAPMLVDRIVISFVPTPQESTFAPCAFKLVIVSYQSLDAIILVSVTASSSIRLASLEYLHIN